MLNYFSQTYLQHVVKIMVLKLLGKSKPNTAQIRRCRVVRLDILVLRISVENLVFSLLFSSKNSCNKPDDFKLQWSILGKKFDV